MNKKKSIFIIIFVVLLVVIVALILASSKQEGNNEVMPNGNQENGEEANMPSEEELAELPAEQRIPVSEENNFVISADGFSPATLYGEAGKRVFITMEATDGMRHVIASEDEALKDLFLVVINEGEEPKSVAFIAPEPGEYSFYVDEKDNMGTLIIE